MREEFSETTKVFLFILALIVVASVVFFGLRMAGVFGERVVFENSFQYSEARKSEIATYEAQMAEIERKLTNTNLDESTRRNLEAQMSALRIRLQAARSKQ